MNCVLKTQAIVTDYEGDQDFPAQFAEALGQVSTLTEGTGSGNANVCFSDTRSLAASATEDLDLAGSLKDPFGYTITFTYVKAILIMADSDNGDGIEVEQAAANGFAGPFTGASEELDIPAGGAIMSTYPGTGWAVTAGTGDLLTITNGDGSAAASYTVAIVGVGTVA